MKKIKKGLVIAIDGTDGSGKHTQTELLVKWLKKQGHKVRTISLPSHNEPCGYFADQYLAGTYSKTPEGVSSKPASIFYALDRYHQSETKIKPSLAKGEIWVLDRWVTANMGHQGSKIKNKKKREEYYKWLYELEYEILGIPKPNLNILLHVSSEINAKLISKRGNKQDIHEKDANHLKKAEQAYLTMAKMFPRDMKLIECVKNGQIMNIEEIHELIKEKVKKIIK